MKIGILTHYDVNNLGAQLQMYGLYNFIKESGHDPIILTYNKNFDFKQDEKLKNQITIKSIPYILNNYLIKKGFKLTLFNVKKYNINKEFRNKNFQFEFYANADIDLVVVGSDEVFSIPVGINIMMYGHGLKTNKCVSYAPSFGQTDIEMIHSHNCFNLISSGLKGFKNLSARDDNTKMLINLLTGRDADIVIDPVILYDFSSIKREVKTIGKYILIYSMDRWMNDLSEVNAIKSFAKAKGLKTVSVGTYHKWCDLNINCDCLEWIEYFRNANFIISDTFHGTVLSIITNVPMAIFVRKENSNKIIDLLTKTSLLDRRILDISSKNLDLLYDQCIDFNLVNNNLTKLRSDSSKYLLNALEVVGDCNHE